MKLKPSLLQLTVVIMTLSLISSCTATPETSQQDCINPKNPQQTQQNNCPPNSNSGNSSGSSGRYIYRNSTGTSPSRIGDTHTSPSKSGRGGFGSFGRSGGGRGGG
ncbi:MAG: hypothetical protein VKL59_05450 [Nostocaceae cyanobacterium]|nr:hypothetical protein [Nostocaceae cyanobacterium]